MNASHRSIWNDSLGAWVATAELTSARGKRNQPSDGRRPNSSSCGPTRLQALALALGAMLSAPQAGAQTNLGGGLGIGGNHIAIGSSPAAPCSLQADSAYKLAGGVSVLNSGAVADGVGSIAIGSSCAYPAAAVGAASFALGVNAFSLGDYSFAMGRDATAAAANSIAIGSGSSAQVLGGTALGSGARVLDTNFHNGEGVVDRRAGNGGSSNVVLPISGATLSVGAGVAVGATTAYRGSVSVGFDNVAGDLLSPFRAVALGSENLANGIYATALGMGNTVNGLAAVALGVVNQASGNTSIAIGRQSYASGDFSIAQGNAATARDWNAIAIGNSSGATAKGAIAIGGGSDGSTSLLDPTGVLASGVNAVAIGTSARATGTQSISIGTGNIVAGNRSGAFGDPSYINADSAYGIGNSNTIDSAYTFVLGNNVTVAAGLDGAVVLGNNSSVAASNPTASATIAGRTYSFAGAAPWAGGVVSVGASGAERQVTHVAAGRISGTSTDAINGSQLFAANQAIDTLNAAAVLLGNTVTTLGVTLGNVAGSTSTTYTDANGVGIRYVRTNEAGLAPTDSFASGQGATAVGYNALASAAGAVALGRDATSAIGGGIALGQGSVSDRTVTQGAGAVPGYGSVQFNTTGRTLLGAVSVGSASGNTYRQITNVADGTQGQDAATVAQLGALSGTLAGSSTKYFHANSTAADSLSSGAESIAVGPQTVVNSASGIGIGNGATVQMVATGGTAIGQAAAVSSVDGLAIGTQATADATRGVAIGAGATVTHADSVALGSNAVTATGSQTGYAAYALMAPQNSAGEISVGRSGAERQITNVAAGSADTDAVNVAQLKAVAMTASNSVQYDNASRTTVTLAGPSSIDGGATGGTGITNLHQGALGATSTDAVNGSQLFQTNRNLAQLGATVTTLGNAVDTLGNTLTHIAGDTGNAFTLANGTGIRYVRTNESSLVPSDSFASGQGATAVGYNAASSGLGSVAIGRDSSAVVAGGVALGQGSVSDRAVTPGSGVVPGFAAVPYNTTNGTLLGAVSVGSATANTYRQITNMADGTQGQDAASVAQLQALSGTLSNTAQKYFHANSNGGDSISGGADSIAVGPRTVINGDSAIGIGNGATVQMVATGGTAIGQAASVGQADGIALGTQANVDAQRGVAIGAGAAVTHADSVALGAGAVTSVGSRTGYTAFASSAPQNSAGEVSVGSKGAERQVTNVAAGSAETDAVNLGQLQSAQAGNLQYDRNPDGSTNYGSATLGNGQAPNGTVLSNVAPGVKGTDAVNVDQLNGVRNALKGRIDDVARYAYAGVASAMAVQMPSSYVPGKTVMRVGAGIFKGQSAVGVSFRRTAENNAFSVSGGVGASRAGVAAAVGAEWVFN
ncbi:YadA-like family protein [soil metagenome]